MKLYASKLKSGTWNHIYMGSKRADKGSWRSSQDQSISGFWFFNWSTGKANVFLDSNGNNRFDPTDDAIGIATPKGNNGSLEGGAWNRFKSETGGVFSGSSWGFEKITAKLIMDTSSGKDVITGNQKNNYINGKAGNDKLAGAGGNDIILGGSGRDILYGGAGKDTLVGGTGKDKLHGGSGKDKFKYLKAKHSRGGKRNCDIIYDFSKKDGDRIDLSKIDAYQAKRGNQKFKFIGDKEFSGKRGEVQFSKGALLVNDDKNKKPDMMIIVKGVNTFSKRSLIL